MPDHKATNITWQDTKVSPEDHRSLMGHKGATIWCTGLSGAGKSTVAVTVERMLFERGCHTYVLDGDNIRHGLNRDLGFSPEDRAENIRRIGEVAALLADAGLITLTAFISPYAEGRNHAREARSSATFIEVFCDCPLEICEQRDTKGLYRKARAGEIKDFTGIDAPYEIPDDAEIVLHTDKETVEESAAKVVAYLEEQGIIPGK